jgi:tyrosine-protein kinase Etk/Wzc
MEEIKASVPDKRKKADDSIFNLKWIVTTVLTVWPWLLASVVVALIIGNLRLRYATPIYRSSAELMINDSKKGSSSGQEDILTALKLNNNRISIDNEIEILRSRTMMTEVVKSLNLNYDYSIPGRFKTTIVYSKKPFELVLLDSVTAFHSFKIAPVNSDFCLIATGPKSSVKVKYGDSVTVNNTHLVVFKTAQFARTNVAYSVTVAPVIATAKRYMSAVEIVSKGKATSCLTLTMLDAIPERSVDIINTLMRVYKQRNINSRTLIAERTMEFIDKRLGIVFGELSGVEDEIVGFKQKNEIADMTAQSSALVGASSATMEKLAVEEVQLDAISSVSDYLQKADNDESIILPASLLENVGLSAMMTNFNNLQLQIQTSLVVNTLDNPNVKNLIEQKKKLKENIQRSLLSTKREIQLKVNKIKSELGGIKSDIRDVPNVERIFLDYSRKQQTKQDLYIFLLKKREETAIEKSSTVADALIVDPAMTDGWPVSPNRSKILTTSLLFGLLIPFGFILIRRGLNIKIISKGDILRVTEVPIIGEIGNNVSRESVAVERNSRSLIAEQFRALRTNLQYMLTDKEKKTLLITSSMSSEGKSFIALNLAITFAMTGKKVVLLEFDLRKPRISKMLGLENNIGFSSYIIGNSSFSDIIIPSGLDDNLFILPSGPIPPNPAELIMLQQTEDMFDRLRREFDYVIIDTSPIGLVTDAQLLYKYADLALYIVRQGYTKKAQLNIPNDLFLSGKMPNLGIIVNDVIANRGFAYGYGYEENYGYGYGYGGGYGYGYGYGASYGDGYYINDKKKTGFFSKWKKNRN